MPDSARQTNTLFNCRRTFLECQKKTVTFISAAQGPWFKFCAAVRGHALNPGRRPQAIYHTDQCIGESAESYIFYILSSIIFSNLILLRCTVQPLYSKLYIMLCPIGYSSRRGYLLTMQNLNLLRV
jgi:hypothetical protein